MHLKGNLILLTAAIIWGTAFVAQRIGAEHLGPFLFNGIRFLIASLILWPFFTKRKYKLFDSDLKRLAIPGVFLFLGSAFQQAGLKYTTAGNAGFITGLYVVLVPVILGVLYRHKINFRSGLAVACATAGLYFLSITDSFSLAPGDGLELVGAFFWAAHVIVVARFVANIPVIKLATGQFIVCAFLNIFFGLVTEWGTFGGIVAAAPALIYTGVFSIAIGFTLQVLGQKYTTPTTAAIILSLEAVFALLFGFIFLGEQLGARQITGASLMFLAMMIAQLKPDSTPELK